MVSEYDWADEYKTENPYTRSKILQERAAWNYWNSLPEDSRFELVVMNPGNMFGPVYKREDFASANIIKAVFKWSKYLGFPKVYYQAVDVRDVALAHL